jgi:hydroxyacid-oxoacid transhydrogenase
MPCCHADFAAVEGSDRGFTIGMPTFTFGSGVLAEAGDNARELGMKRVALFTDGRLCRRRSPPRGSTSRSTASA